jgi:hypothetical protein
MPEGQTCLRGETAIATIDENVRYTKVPPFSADKPVACFEKGIQVLILF